MSIDQPGISSVYSSTTISVSSQDTSSVDSAFPRAFNSSQSYVVKLAPDASLAASFDLNYSGITINVARGAELVNDGSATLAGSEMTINAAALGVGSSQVSALVAPLVPDTGYLVFGNVVSRGETVTIGNPTISEDGIDWDELKIDQPRAFQGSVVLQPNAFVELAVLAKADSYSYGNDRLSIWSGDRVIDTLLLTNRTGGDLVAATDASGDVVAIGSEPAAGAHISAAAQNVIHLHNHQWTECHRYHGVQHQRPWRGRRSLLHRQCQRSPSASSVTASSMTTIRSPR